jgi:hypothetical protein
MHKIMLRKPCFKWIEKSTIKVCYDILNYLKKG